MICITEFEVEILLDLITVDPDLQLPDVEELPETEEGEVVPSLAMVTHGKHQVSPKLEEICFFRESICRMMYDFCNSGDKKRQTERKNGLIIQKILFFDKILKNA